MDQTLLAAIVSALVAGISLLVGYIQWRRDVRVRLGAIREEISIELVRQRIEPYAKLMLNLESASTLHAAEVKENPTELLSILQKAIYGKVGLLASHQTRQVLLYVRQSVFELADNSISYGELATRLWALHLALRSDLGINQPEWPSEIEQVHNSASRDDESAYKRIQSYDFRKIDLAGRDPHRLEQEQKVPP